VSAFAQVLIAWHATHGRHDLPWQRDADPYRIWLSEIMLQQTRVETVIPYFERFLARFPDLRALAAAPLDEVLGLWSGLGYYARARNLHRAAREIVTVHGGRFPQDPEAIARLPGVGRSTAAAIAVFAFGARAAILDGNVRRVLCRVFAVEGYPGDRAVEQQLWALAGSLLPQVGVATYIQAQMDLGATVCTRSRPRCDACPLARQCVAALDGRIRELPAPRPQRARPLRLAQLAFVYCGDQVLLLQRPPSGIWGGLLVPPEVPERSVEPAAWLAARFGVQPVAGVRAGSAVEHAFTHFRLQITPLWCEVGRPSGRSVQEPDEGRWVRLGALESLALPAPVRRLLETLRDRG
jgi:A/G-specific adenine glycosylase